MPSFDLLSESWIPILDAETDLRVDPDAPVALRTVGLREALIRAHEIREVYCDSPLETVALYRLLLALFIDACAPSPDKEAWRTLWRAGHLDPAVLDAYFARPDVMDRFDLLHPTQPFYQHPEPHPSQKGKDPASLSKLFHAEASGNNATLFGHEMDGVPRSLPLAAVARGILATQAAALGGGVSKPFNFSHGPLVGGAVFWLRGGSLFEALLLNAPPDPKARMVIDAPIHQVTERPPVWRRDLPTEHKKRPVEGYLDYLTWQARRITLDTEEQNGETVATGVYLTQGDKDDPLADDPLMATVVTEKKGTFPFGFREGRALWRDADTLFKLYTDGGSHGPRTLVWLQNHARRVIREEAWHQQVHHMDVFGLINDQAKMILWQQARLPVFMSLLGDMPRLRLLHTLLGDAEAQKSVLRGAVRTVAEYLLNPPPPGADPKEKPKADTTTASNLVKSLAAEERYWAALEAPFFALLADLAQAPHDDLDELRWSWAEQIYQTARSAFRDATAMLDQNSRQLRAVAEGQRWLGAIKEYRAHQQTLKEEAI